MQASVPGREGQLVGRDQKRGGEVQRVEAAQLSAGQLVRRARPGAVDLDHVEGGQSW